jgi:hypothetical protein
VRVLVIDRIEPSTPDWAEARLAPRLSSARKAGSSETASFSVR